MTHHALLEGSKACGNASVRIGVRGGEISGDAIHIGPRLFDIDARLEATQRVKSQACAANEQRRIAPLTDGHIYLAFAETGDPKKKARRNYSNNGVAAGIQGDVLSKDVRRGTKFALPQTLADQRYWCCPHRLFFGGEGAPDYRFDTKQGEKIVR